MHITKQKRQEQMNTKPKIKAIIFDLDGTLLDSIHDIAVSMNLALAEIGLPEYPEEDYKGFVGGGFTELVKKVLPSNKQSTANIESLKQRFWETYEVNWFLHTTPFPGILYLIQSCIARKIRLSILSNKPHYFTKKMLRNYFRGVLIKHFKNPFGIYSGEQPDKPAKPDPTVALELAEKLGIAPEFIAFIGDSDVDIQTAKNAGMISIGAAWGYRDKAELKAAKADLIFDTPLDLVKYIESQPSI